MTDEQLNIPEFTDKDKRVTAFHNFNENKEVIGKLLSIDDGTFGKQYKVLTKDGEVTVGTYDVLKSKISDKDVGKYIKIVFKGNVKSKKTKATYNDFEVSVK